MVVDDVVSVFVVVEPVPPAVPLPAVVSELAVEDGLLDAPGEDGLVELPIPDVVFDVSLLVVVVVLDGLEEVAPVFAARSLQPAATSNAAAIIA